MLDGADYETSVATCAVLSLLSGLHIATDYFQVRTVLITKKGHGLGSKFEIHQNVYLIASSYYSSRLNEGLGEGQSKVEEWLVVL